jgi:hypothetical protein
MTIPLNTKSIIAGYARVFTALFAAIGFLLASGNSSMMIIGLIFLVAWIYFFFVYGQAKDEEIEQRQKIGNITGIYALPEWLDSADVYSIYEKLEKKYTLLTNGSDWLVDIQQNSIPKERLRILYALSYLNYE